MVDAIVLNPTLSCSAKAEHPVSTDVGVTHARSQSHVRRILDRPLRRAMTPNLRLLPANLCSFLAQSAPAQQRVGRWQPAAKGGVELGRIARAARRIDVVAQAR